MKRTALSVLVAVALVSAACAEGEVLVSPPGGTSLAGTRWVVTGFTVDGTGGLLPAGIHLTLDFDDAGGVHGTAGCNSYFGAVAFTAGGIALTGIGSTEMACDPDVMEREAYFLAALGRVGAFTLEDDHLGLRAGDGTVSIDLVPFVPEADRPLAGTTWHLTTLIEGDAASSTVAGTDPTLVVDTLAGSVGGSTGCNQFGGPATFGEGTVAFGDLVATEMACDPAVMRQEAFVFEVLGAAATWEIEGTRLRLTATDGRALEFTAE